MIRVNATPTRRAEIRAMLADMPTERFKLMGLGNLAYIRRVEVGGAARHAVCGADGTVLSVFDSDDEARAAIARNDMNAGTATLH
jgi:hypothetical protein